jgi:hypothetical protein
MTSSQLVRMFESRTGHSSTQVYHELSEIPTGELVLYHFHTEASGRHTIWCRPTDEYEIIKGIWYRHFHFEDPEEFVDGSNHVWAPID